MESYYNLRESNISNLDTSLSDNLLFYGENFFARLNLADLNVGDVGLFTRPPTTLEQQINIPKDALVTKEYVDSIQTNGGKNFYLNFSNTDPVHTRYKLLSPTVDLNERSFIQTSSLGINMIAQFISDEINVFRLQAGLFTLNQWELRTGDQGSVQFYFQIYLFLSNTLVGTSGLSNNASTSTDLFTMVLI